MKPYDSSFSLVFLAVASIVAAAAQAAEPGFVEDFNSGDISDWSGGADVYLWVASGGVGGEEDGYLEVANTDPGHLGVRTTSENFTGDLMADGVTGFSCWLLDTGEDDSLEIHVGVGTAFLNFWVSVEGFSPPADVWGEFVVDFADPKMWVQTEGVGTFEEALQASDRLLFRHDLPPIEQFPDEIAADFGIDRITVLPAGEPCAGDVNGDEVVDPLDVGFVLSRFGCTVGKGDANCDASDANTDGLVDPLDVGFVQSRFGTCP